jgi:hypothetical protein
MMDTLSFWFWLLLYSHLDCVHSLIAFIDSFFLITIQRMAGPASLTAAAGALALYASPPLEPVHAKEAVDLA